MIYFDYLSDMDINALIVFLILSLVAIFISVKNVKNIPPELKKIRSYKWTKVIYEGFIISTICISALNMMFQIPVKFVLFMFLMTDVCVGGLAYGKQEVLKYNREVGLSRKEEKEIKREIVVMYLASALVSILLLFMLFQI